MSSSNDGSNGSIGSGDNRLGSINMYKAITPLDYMGPPVTLDTTTEFTKTDPDSSVKIFTWTGDAGDIINNAYNGNRLVLMDRICIRETNTISSGLSSIADPGGILRYTIELADSALQIINKYCEFGFTINYSGVNLSTFEVDLYVTTSWMSNPKIITVKYSNGISAGTIDIPKFYVDWTDSTALVKTVLDIS